MNPGNEGQTAERAGGFGFPPDAVSGPQEAVAQFAVPAHGSGRGSSRTERRGNEGYREHSSRISEEILNSGSLTR